MSYLTQYAARAPSARAASPAARIDERTRLNRPGYYGDAYIRVFVEDTSAWAPGCGSRRTAPPAPYVELEIADCVNTVNLEFSVESAGDRDNALYKLATLLAVLHRFRDALAAEAELYAELERRTRGS